MKGDFHIQKATPMDLDAIKDVLGAYRLPKDDITPEHLTHFLVIRQDGDLVGTVGLEKCGYYGLLRSLVVLDSHRGRGLGNQLTSEIETYARSCEVQELYLLTTTAAPFFTKLGYSVIDRGDVPIPIQGTQEFKSICPASAVCMLKRIKNDQKTYSRRRP
jgi:amino-acid N-acetyltransferase